MTLDDDQALAFVKMVTDNEDQAFDQLLGMVRPAPVPDSDAPQFDPEFVVRQQAVFFLIMQEHKMRDLDEWPQAVRDHETARTERMRERLREKFGEHFEGWYERLRRESPDLLA